VTVVSSPRAGRGQHLAGLASRRGTRIVRLRAGGARPGRRVVIHARVSLRHRRASCRLTVRLRHARSAGRKPRSSSCTPLSNEGTCYEPGEFCRDSDHGASGIAGDGKRIVCEDNDGWRWEPAGTAPSPAPTTTPSPPATGQSCYPLSDEGTCYEPGEFCRDSDHGASGIAGDGKRIVCEDNDGWRWEPA
jgi:hypothetical protein